MTTSKELSLPQRAAVALGTAEHEQRLIALVKESERIIDVKNKAGRDECHTAYMVLKNTRISITGLADNATEDAKAFTKAVKAEALRLLDITKAEESRLQELRDAFDAQVQAEKDAKIAAERARLEKIQLLIAGMREWVIDAAGKPSKAIQEHIDCLQPPTAALYHEFIDDATQVFNDSISKLNALKATAVDQEIEAKRQQAEREAAEAKAKQEREELAAAQAELKRQQAEAQAEIQRQRDAMAAEMKAEHERSEDLRKREENKRQLEDQAQADAARIAKAEQDRITADHAQKMAAQQAAMDARQRDLDHTEALLLNAQFDQLAAARKLEAETAAAVEMVAAVVEEAPQGNSSVINDRPIPARPTDNELIVAVATTFGVDLSDALEWLSSFGE